MPKLVLVLFLAALAGCATETQTSQTDRVSTIPWNRPERWEGQGAMGGFMPGSR